MAWIGIISYSCSYEGPDDIPGLQECDTAGLSYETGIKQIINANCALPTCHGGNQTPLLTNYPSVYANRNEIMQRAVVERTMPPSGPLGQCSIEKLKTWIDNGAPEFPADTTGGNIQCDTNVVLAYNGQVKTIIDQNCATSGCHLDGPQRPWFSNYLAVYNNRQLILEKAVESDQMPPNSTLDSCSKEVLRKWIEAGAIESEGDSIGGCSPSTPRYTNDIQLIFEASCAVSGCHDGNHPKMNFTSYNDFLAIQADGDLDKIIKKTELPDPDMPKVGALDPCSIERIKNWINSGIPE